MAPPKSLALTLLLVLRATAGVIQPLADRQLMATFPVPTKGPTSNILPVRDASTPVNMYKRTPSEPLDERNLLDDLANGIKKEVTDKINDGIDKIGDGIKTIINGGNDIFDGATSKIGSIIKGAPTKIASAVNGAPSKAGQVFKEVTGGGRVGEVVNDGLPTVALSAVDAIPTKVGDVFKGVTSKIGSVIDAAPTKVVGAITGAPAKITSIAGAASSKIGSAVQAVPTPGFFGNVEDIASKIVSAVKGAPTGVVNDVEEIVSRVIDVLKSVPSVKVVG